LENKTIIRIGVLDKKEIKILLKQFRIIGKEAFGSKFKLIAPEKPKRGSHCRPKEKHIYLNITDDEDHIIYHFFHEMGHIEAFEEGAYKEYNNVGHRSRMTRKHCESVIRYGLKAERNADMRAFKLMKKYGYKVNKEKLYTYASDEAAEIYEKNFVKYHRQWLEKRGML
jgi:hypothetical protein